MSQISFAGSGGGGGGGDVNGPGVSVNGDIVTWSGITGTNISDSGIAFGVIAANELIYAPNSATIQGLATANNGVLITSGGGVPSIGSTLPAAVQGNITAVGTIASGTWQGTPVGVVYGGTGLSSTTINQLLYSSSNNTIAGLTAGANGVLISSNSDVPSWLANGTAGYVLTANTGAPPSWQAAAGGGISTITGNSGGAISPSAGNIGLVGTGSTTVVGLGNSLTVEMTGLTNHNVLVGAGSATITNVAPSAGSGIALISQGASSDPTFGTVVVAGGGTGLGTLTAHNVLLGEGTSNVGFAAPATAGQVLVDKGASADPVFGYVSGQLVEVETHTASNSGSIAFTTGFTASYSTYLLKIRKFLPATSGNPLLTFSTNAGSSYLGSGYQWALFEIFSGGGTTFSTSNSSDSTILGGDSLSNTAANAYDYDMTFYNMGSGTTNSRVVIQCSGTNSSSWINWQTIAGQNPGTGAVNAVKIVMAAGNITSGVFTLYGVVEP